jgi:tetratricopeptide (TPR) repeat protein
VEGNAAFKQGDLKKALHLYSDGIDMCKDHKQLRTNRALVCNKLGRYPEAIEDCTKVLDICELFEGNSGPGVKDARLKSLSRRATAYKARAPLHTPPLAPAHLRWHFLLPCPCPPNRTCRQGMGQLAEAVADAELALSLDPSNKEIETQLRGLRTDLRDADTAKSLQQQLQQPAPVAAAHASADENVSPLGPLPETKAPVSDAKPLTSQSLSASSTFSSNPEVAESKSSALHASATAAAPAAASAPAASLSTPIDHRLVSANSLLQVMRWAPCSTRQTA